MANQKDDIAIQLWRYLDGDTNPAEQEAISHLIAIDPVWKEQYTAQLLLHRALVTNIIEEQPPMRFTKNVLDAIAGQSVAKPTTHYVNPKIMKWIATVFIGNACLLLAYCFYSINWSIPLALPDSGLQLPAVSSTQVWEVGMAATIILTLILLDAIFRNGQDTNKRHANH